MLSKIILWLAITLNQAGLYDESLSLLNSAPSIQFVDNLSYQQYHFYRACAASDTKQYDIAIESCNKILNNFNKSERRYINVAQGLLDQVTSYRNDKLRDIETDMLVVNNRLKGAKAGPKTQKIEEGIIKKLDDLIKESEDKLANSSSNGDADSDKDSKKNNPSKPTEQSKIAGSEGTGQIDQKKLKNYAENWGKLPPSERAKAVTEMTRDLPPRHRQLVEDYFKALNRSK